MDGEDDIMLFSNVRLKDKRISKLTPCPADKLANDSGKEPLLMILGISPRISCDRCVATQKR